MKMATVVGNVWSTRKSEELRSYKLLIVRPFDEKKGKTFIAADSLGAGIGEIVITVGGSGARSGSGNTKLPVDATIVAIVDEDACEEKEYV